MIERASEFGASASVPLSQGDTSQMSAGHMLRQAREAHGLHLEVVAAALKVPAQKLLALEEDRIDLLPDPVFARALAASVCRALRIEPGPVLAKLPDANRAALAESDRSMGGTIRSRLERTGGARGALPSRPTLIVVGLLLVGAAALFWLPQPLLDRAREAIASRMPAESARPEGEGTVTTPGGVVEPVASAAPGASVSPATPAPVPAAVAPAGTVPAPALPGAAAAPTDGAPAPAAAAAAAAGKDTLVFTAKAESWITVTQAGGKILLRRTVSPGETVGVSGEPPLSVVVGRASGVEVLVRGQPYDLAPVTRGGGVARFEVKP